MTDFAISLAVVSTAVAGVSIAGFLWIGVERRRAEAETKMEHSAASNGQRSLDFPDSRELLATGSRER